MQRLHVLDDGGDSFLPSVLPHRLQAVEVKVTNRVDSLEVGSWRPSLGLALKVPPLLPAASNL